MADRKYRVLLISSHPVPNEASVLERGGREPGRGGLVGCCAGPREYPGDDPEFITKMAFDTGTSERFPWISVPNRAPRPRLGRFFGLFNPGLARLVLRCDCCVVFGYAYASLCIAILTTKLMGKRLLLSTDAISLDSARGGRWKSLLKRLWLPRVLRLADVVLVPSTAGKRFVISLGMPAERVVLTPYVVDNEVISSRASLSDRGRVRAGWGIPEADSVVLFCGKFIARKRPLDVVSAFARLPRRNVHLVLVGDGPLRQLLVEECRRLGIVDRVRFPGLVKYSELPDVYVSADVLVVASDHEPWGLTVNEAMLCGIPVIVSDRVGSGEDLVEDGVSGFVYPVGDIDMLARALGEVFGAPDRPKQMGQAARLRMERWSPDDNARAVVRAVEIAMARGKGAGGRPVA